MKDLAKRLEYLTIEKAVNVPDKGKSALVAVNLFWAKNQLSALGDFTQDLASTIDNPDLKRMVKSLASMLNEQGDLLGLSFGLLCPDYGKANGNKAGGKILPFTPPPKGIVYNLRQAGQALSLSGRPSNKKPRHIGRAFILLLGFCRRFLPCFITHF